MQASRALLLLAVAAGMLGLAMAADTDAAPEMYVLVCGCGCGCARACLCAVAACVPSAGVCSEALTTPHSSLGEAEVAAASGFNAMYFGILVLFSL